MKFLHLADLHLGKSLYGVSMIDNQDQPEWVKRFLELASETKPDAVVIAGDVYDRSSPSGDAIDLMDRMVTGLADMGIPVLMISGNHDSGQRLSFAGDILAREKVYIAGTLEKKIQKVTLEDEYGPVNFWLLPYLFPALVSQKLEDENIRDYQTAMCRILEEQKMDFSERNVLIAHQNITANGVEAIRGGSETMVGGVGQVDYRAFDGIDYVALGHIHSAYPVGRETVRYAGSPLCYHFDEIKQQKKGPVQVEIGKKEKGQTEIHIETELIEPLHPLRELKDSYENVRAILENDKSHGEYVRLVITDQKITPQIAAFLRNLLEQRNSILMELVSEFHDQKNVTLGEGSKAVEEKAIEELFEQFYIDRKADAQPLEKQKEILHYAGELLRNEDKTGIKEADEADVEKLLKFVLGQED